MTRIENEIIPEFSLEANDVEDDSLNECVYFDYEDIQICFLDHCFCT